MSYTLPGIYQHWKGGLYEVIGVALHTETNQPMVVYRRCGHETWKLFVRPMAMFNGNVQGGKLRFEFVRTP